MDQMDNFQKMHEKIVYAKNDRIECALDKTLRAETCCTADRKPKRNMT